MGKTYSRKQVVQSTLAVAVIFMLAGPLFALAGYYLFLRPEFRALNEFQEATATVIDKQVASEITGSGAKRKTKYRPEIHYSYVVDGQEYHSHTYHLTNLRSGSIDWPNLVIAEFEIGKQYPCYYDPSNPETAVLHRGVTTTGWIFTFSGVAVFLIGVIVLCVLIFRRVTNADDSQLLESPPTNAALQ